MSDRFASDEYNECNVPTGSTPAACLQNQAFRAAHFLQLGEITEGEEAPPGSRDDGASRD